MMLAVYFIAYSMPVSPFSSGLIRTNGIPKKPTPTIKQAHYRKTLFAGFLNRHDFVTRIICVPTCGKTDSGLQSSRRLDVFHRLR